MKKSCTGNILRLMVVIFLSCSEPPKSQSFQPGKLWPDDQGTHINAHGGGFLYHEGLYYWFGEHKIAGRAGNKAHVGIHVYSSEDLYNWKDRGIALPVVEDDTLHDITKGSVMERPKVVYNETTNKFVMWFHLELWGQGYRAARTAVAVSDDPVGPYTYIKSFRPNAGQWPINFPDSLKDMDNYDPDVERWSEEGTAQVEKGIFLVRDFEKGQMARDMTVFVDDDGTAYHIHSSEENETLHISELTEDYLEFTGKYARVLPAGRNEAPAIIKRNGKYVMITSGLTGWDPNAAKVSTADHILGTWETHGNPCVGDRSEVTFGAQSTFILKVEGMEDTYIFMADQWRPENAIDGRYVWLPIEFEEGLPVIKWYDEWSY